MLASRWTLDATSNTSRIVYGWWEPGVTFQQKASSLCLKHVSWWELDATCSKRCILYVCDMFSENRSPPLIGWKGIDTRLAGRTLMSECMLENPITERRAAVTWWSQIWNIIRLYIAYTTHSLQPPIHTHQRSICSRPKEKVSPRVPSINSKNFRLGPLQSPPDFCRIVTYGGSPTYVFEPKLQKSGVKIPKGAHDVENCSNT